MIDKLFARLFELATLMGLVEFAMVLSPLAEHADDAPHCAVCAHDACNATPDAALGCSCHAYSAWVQVSLEWKGKPEFHPRAKDGPPMPDYARAMTASQAIAKLLGELETWVQLDAACTLGECEHTEFHVENTAPLVAPRGAEPMTLDERINEALRFLTLAPALRAAKSREVGSRMPRPWLDDEVMNLANAMGLIEYKPIRDRAELKASHLEGRMIATNGADFAAVDITPEGLERLRRAAS